MPFFSPGVDWHTNPNAAGSGTPFGGGYTGLESWAAQTGLGKAGKYGKQLMGAMMGGDYSGLAGSLLAPIHDQYATNLREALRGNTMGGNAMVQGSQPALMANIEQDTRRKMAEGEGMAYGQAIPQTFQMGANMYQNALNTQTQAQLAALQAAMQGRIAGTTPVQTPSTFSNIMNSIGGVGSVLSMI